MGAFGYVTVVIVAAAAFGCSAYVYVVMGNKENVTPQELAPLLVAVVTTGVGLFVALAQAVAYFVYYRSSADGGSDTKRSSAARR